jgi:F-box protein 11
LQAKVALRNCRVFANRATGLSLTSFAHADIQDCDFCANRYTGAEVSREALAVFTRCRIFEHVGSCGLYFHLQGRGALEDCVVFLNHTSGIEVTTLARVDLRRCDIHCNLRHGIDVYRKGEVHLVQCALEDNILEAFRAESDCIVEEVK